MTLLTDPFEEEQFIAGEYVACGTYQEVGTTTRFRFAFADYLPLSSSGMICWYLRIANSDI